MIMMLKNLIFLTEKKKFLGNKDQKKKKKRRRKELEDIIMIDRCQTIYICSRFFHIAFPWMVLIKSKKII